MYESPIKLNDLEWELNPIDHVIKDAAKSVGEQFDRYILSAIAKTGITVDRDELVKALRYDRGQYREGYEDGVENGIGFATPKWIPVTERLPEETGNYLVVFDCGHGAEVHEAYYFKYFDSGEWYDPVEEYQKYNPTHWMPLPKPPKDGET